jgi:hypothetical protein
MQVTARQAARQAVRDESGLDAPAFLPADAIRVELGQPTPLDVGRRQCVAPRRGEPQESVDLAPARGMVTAVAFGLALWVGIGLVVRALAF